MPHTTCIACTGSAFQAKPEAFEPTAVYVLLVSCRLMSQPVTGSATVGYAVCFEVSQWGLCDMIIMSTVGPGVVFVSYTSPVTVNRLGPS